MIGVSRKISFSYQLIRLLGLFPYTWNDIKDTTTGLKTKPGCISLKKSVIWKTWSLIFTVVIVVIVSFDFYSSIARPRGLINGLQTLLIAHMIYDASTAAGVLVLQVLCWWHYEQLAEVVSFASEICREVRVYVPPIWKNYTTILLYVLSFISVGIALYSYIFGWHNRFDNIVLVSLSVRYFMFVGLMTCIAVLYHNNMEVSALLGT